MEKRKKQTTFFQALDDKKVCELSTTITGTSYSIFITYNNKNHCYYTVHVHAQLLGCIRLWATHGLQPTRLLCPCDFPGKNNGVGCHFLLQGILSTQRLNPHLLQLLYCKWILLPLSHQGSPHTNQVFNKYLLNTCIRERRLLLIDQNQQTSVVEKR